MSLLREITLMKTLTTLITILFISLLCSPSWSERHSNFMSTGAASWNDLIKNPSNGLFYRKFTSEPFTGSIVPFTGSIFDVNEPSNIFMIGTVKDEKIEGLNELYHSSGLVWVKTFYKDGKDVGPAEHYNNEGFLTTKRYYNDEKKEGLWKYFNEDGTLEKTETYKDGELVD